MRKGGILRAAGGAFVAASLLGAVASAAAPNIGSVAVRPGGMNVEPAMRPWRYHGPNPDGWWCRSPNCNGVPNGTVFIDRELRLAAALGVRSLRVEFPWLLIEPRRGVFDWRRADYIVQGARRLHVPLQPVLEYTPPWAGASESSPPQARDFAAFARAFAARYKRSIQYYEFWDEPDLDRYWDGSEQQYVENVLVPGYRAVKAADRGAKVILGGMSYANVDWLNGIYALNGGNAFDIAAYHDYLADRRVLRDAYIVRNVLVAHGQRRKPIWLGEYGVQESGLGDIHQQALIEEVLTERAPIAMAQWYNLRDDVPMTCCPPAAIKQSFWGVLTHDYAKKQAFGTMQRLLRRR